MLLKRYTRRGTPRLFSEAWTLIRPFLGITAFATSLGILSGLATAWLLATVNDGLHGAVPIPSLLLRFASLCGISIIGSAIAGVANSVAGQRMIARMRKRIAQIISDTDLQVVERYRPHRLLAIISNDVDTVSAFTFSFPSYAIAFATIIGSLLYLAYLSIPVFLLFVAAVVIAVCLSGYSKLGWAKDYEGVREAQDQLQEQYRAITEGAKEIRLNIQRRSRVHDVHLAGAADTIADLKVSAMRRYWLTGSVGNGIVFVAIGLLLAIQGGIGLTPAVASGAVLVMLYIRGPVEQLLNGLPAFFQAQIAFGRIFELSSTLRSEKREDGEQSDLLALNNSISLSNVRFCFLPNGESKGFEIGPVDLHISCGETLFIVGENGSGKTTLVKLILGLYWPQSGEIFLDGRRVESGSDSAYRQLFSGVFADYFLFSELLEADEEVRARAESYLRDFEISHKVDIAERKFSNIDLSTGQRKRLALIHAYLERRPIIMFDEWAADQDPTFRRAFYERILPDLKAQGKTIIVVSHDDRFFHLADHLIEMRDGHIVRDSFINSPDIQHPSLTRGEGTGSRRNFQ